jgi:GT2 family glycosyltransferase
MLVCICIATCKRPKLLFALLSRLSDLSFHCVATPDIKVVIVDNDEAGSAEAVAQTASLPYPITYVIEPVRGIASARNRCLALSREADFIALIDDDEIPAPNWLDELLSAQQKYSADVVSGIVLPIFPDNIPDWIRDGGFFTRRFYPTGEVLSCCASNNTLIARRVLDAVPGFEEKFKLTGADDTHFFMRVHRAGFKIVSTQLAIVSEAIGRDRANFFDILIRSFHGGNGYVLVERSLDHRLTTRVVRFLKGLVRVAEGFAGVLCSVVLGKTHAVHALRRISKGFGMVAGTAGYSFEPYRTIKGSSS